MRFSGQGWSFVAGPPHVDGVQQSHLMDADPAEYTPVQFATSMLGIEGVELLHDAEPNWWSWKTGWMGEADAFEIGMSLFETEPPLWGGSPISHVSEPAELLALLRALRRQLPSIYLHNEECEILSPAAFAARYLPPPVERK